MAPYNNDNSTSICYIEIKEYAFKRYGLRHRMDLKCFVWAL